MRTRCVTLFLCAVCGLTLHAGDDSAPTAEIAWRPTDPVVVFARPTDGSPWGSDDKTIANCKMQIANCKLGSIAGLNDIDPPFDLQFAIPVGSDSASGLLIGDEPSASAFGFRHDLRGFLPGVWHDARGIVRRENMIILGAVLAASIGIRQDLDDEVREEAAEHSQRWGDTSRVLGYLGEAQYQVPVLGLVWGASLWQGDAELNDFSHALISAYTINGLAVLAIKGIADTERPDPDWNGGRWGFPSFHAASAFTIAGVLDENYGWRAAVPAYTLAGLISWSRIDERDHDLSDVVFGAAMGWVIGKSVAGTHLRNDGRVVFLPWSHPLEAAQGVAVEVRY